MADFQPNTIYGYPGGELIGTSNIMMQVEDYTQTIWCTYRHNHVLPLTHLKSTTINYTTSTKNVPFKILRKYFVCRECMICSTFPKLMHTLEIKYFKLTYICIYTLMPIHTCEMIMYRDNGFCMDAYQS